MPKPPALDNTYGALLLGTVFGTMSQHLLANTINVIEFLVIRLYGLMVHQTYRYYRLYPKDRFWIKSLVRPLRFLLFETLHTTLCIVAVYSQLVTHYFEPATLITGSWRVITGCPSSCSHQRRGVVRAQRSFCVNVGSHYGYKLLVSIPAVSPNNHPVLPDSLHAFIVATTVEAFRLSLTQFPPFGTNSTFVVARLSSIWMCSPRRALPYGNAHYSAAPYSDGIQKVSLRDASNHGGRRTYALLVDPTSVFDSLCFIFALILPGNLIYGGFGSVGVKLYANSVLAVLNSRRSLSERMMQDIELGSFQPNLMQTSPAGSETQYRSLCLLSDSNEHALRKNAIGKCIRIEVDSYDSGDSCANRPREYMGQNAQFASYRSINSNSSDLVFLWDHEHPMFYTRVPDCVGIQSQKLAQTASSHNFYPVRIAYGILVQLEMRAHYGAVRGALLVERLSPPVGLFKFPRAPHLLNLGSATDEDIVVSSRGSSTVTRLANDSRAVLTEKILVQNRSHYVNPSSHKQLAKLGAWLERHPAGLTRYVLFGEWLVATYSIAYDCLPDWSLAFDLYDWCTGRWADRRTRGAPSGHRNSHCAGCCGAGRADGGEGGEVVERGKVVRADFISGNEHWSKGPPRKNKLQDSSTFPTL
ncbi:hypothetical protein C8Q70DRAFT_935927 [Cubamyces menziesii]|nr:hypothetical protein C8Q70DRAFT_935927 [Cubamyces menziesii]